ncbi:MAG: transposase [Armatimonadota bacterium]|nr:transposase [Armatimonadota bacterium]
MSYIRQGQLFTFESFWNEEDDNSRLVMVLSALQPYLAPLVAKLGRERMGRRNHYPAQVLMNAFVAGYVYQIPVKNELIRELRRNGSLRRLVGIDSMSRVPNAWQFSRFMGKLAEDENLALLDDGFHRCVEDLRRLLPGLGRNLGIDGTAVRSWSSGTRDEKTGAASDPDAAWGKREKRKISGNGKVEKVVKKWFGYILTLIVDTDHELPICYDVSPANENECPKLPEVFGELNEKHPHLPIQAVIADAGYDSAANCAYILRELDALPIIKMRLDEGPDAECKTSLCRCTELGVPICDEGSKMRYAGRDGKYLKWRCPAVMEGRDCLCKIDNCSTSAYGRTLKVSIEEDPRRFPGLSRDSHKWRRLYRKRSANERVNARLKGYLLLDDQRVRGKAKVTIQILMSLFVMLASAISMAKLDKLEDVRRIVALAA